MRVIPLTAIAAATVAIMAAWSGAAATDALPTDGENPHPIHLIRPPVGPLSAMAQLGRFVFFDASLSSSGRLSCASCHSPQHAYAAPNALPAMLGGPDLSRQGVRAVPSLMYLEHQPAFSIGPDNETIENVNLAQVAAASLDAPRVQKTADQASRSAANMVPQGGLFWDGRADTLMHQAMLPLLDAREMDGGSIATVAAKLRKAPYADRMLQLFGPWVFNDPRMVVSEALFAIGRYQLEEASFHPYTSKFDYWLEGNARFTPSELRGYTLFNDKAKANCAGCHADQPSRDGLPPLFTDHQYEALGVPRNGALAVNRNPAYFDFGICGPYRGDMSPEKQYCGMFTTPTLRNVTTRHVFFHNGVYKTLQQVLDFYDFRDTEPQKIVSSAVLGNVPSNWTLAGTAPFAGLGAELFWRDTAGNVGMWVINGTQVVSSTVLGNVPTNWSIVGTGDFTGTGTTGLLWRDTSGNVGIWLMNGAQIVSSSVLGNVATNWTVAGTGDFNGDGTTDILWQDTSGNVGLWLMNGTKITSASMLGNVGTNWSVAETGDFNGDGMSDILWRDNAGNVGMWLMNGTKINSSSVLGNVPAIWQIQSANAE
jgi:cytochrome c peroxidase